MAEDKWYVNNRGFDTVKSAAIYLYFMKKGIKLKNVSNSFITSEGNLLNKRPKGFKKIETEDVLLRLYALRTNEERQI